MQLDSKIPEGPLAEKWDKCRFSNKLVNPANKRKYEVIIVGTGLAGASAAASLGELGYNVKSFCINDSPRRAHSIAAQGGINAAKNYQNDGDSIFRLFYDTIKGGDFRAREANVYRLAQVANNIIDQCVAQGVPFAREYGGTLANRSFGGAQVSRTFYARGQTGQQLLLGAYTAMMRQVSTGKVKLYTRREMMDLVVVDGVAKGIVCRNLITGEIEKYSAHAVVLATGGYGNVYFLSTNAMACNVTAAWRAYKKGAGFANPSFVQIHPTCIPVHGEFQSKLTLMSESLRNDGRVWVPKKVGDTRKAADIPMDERDYYLERKYPSFGNLVPRDVASRNAKEACDEGKGVGETKLGVYLDFSDAIKRDGLDVIMRKYGNLFHMYQKITDSDPTKEPMMIYPAIHYTMGGLWVDYELMTTVKGCYAMGECNFSDHGANRLGASALMQGLADGYFVIPYTIGNYLATVPPVPTSTNDPAFDVSVNEVKDQTAKLLKNTKSGKGGQTVDHFHKELGKVMWDNCGMARNKEGLELALKRIPEIRAEFWENVIVPGSGQELNQSLERAGRVADFSSGIY
ncbi:fumarate reductase/succinate dehydrogenase flavoprotein subunit [uncultured Desulfobulbus sp.]|uniref:fumarate reductase/succinate dehydrogenase flavoprotein subunit n=1 Tax=uncultured Desulfobulbus sp. TaxID=239745 RepID=UPI0029C656A0|nr:fumarate reductase/succinate dehydrogenase flavoprotein subunit [uncultured Desulfobulbus sp.]